MRLGINDEIIKNHPSLSFEFFDILSFGRFKMNRQDQVFSQN